VIVEETRGRPKWAVRSVAGVRGNAPSPESPSRSDSFDVSEPSY
jgi:hypothetical protein